MNRKYFGILQMCLTVMLVALITGCDEKKETEKSEETAVSKQKESEGTVAPEQKDQPKKVKLETSMGDIIIELNVEAAPVTVKNFLQYVEESFYDGTIFHRVIPNFMIQGGGFDSDIVEKQTRGQIINEAANGLKNDRGTIAMARTPDPDSATSQFFINHKDNHNLNYIAQRNAGYAVFGKVVEGMDVVDKIAAVKQTTKAGTMKGRKRPMQNVPAESVVIKSAKVVTK